MAFQTVLTIGLGASTAASLPLALLSMRLRAAAVTGRGDALRALAASEARLARAATLARTDALTGLPNRRALDDELPRELARAARSRTPLCVVAIDLDGFKALNDAEGHQAGDRLLKECAAAWRACLREVDLIARLGGDEFAVVLPACPADQAARVGERLRAATPPGVTASLGVAAWNGRDGADGLLRRADRALYAAKRAGRDRTVVAAC